MTLQTLLWRSLRFHWRTHLGVTLGAAVGSATLMGALVVGDSVRRTLETRALERLGNTAFALQAQERFFTDSFFQGSGAEASGWHPPTLVLHLVGSAARSDGSARANRVHLYGITPEFWRLAAPGDPTRAPTRPVDAPEGVAASKNISGTPARHVRPGEVWINEALARRLTLSAGDELLLRVPRPNALSPEAAVSPRAQSSGALRLTVAGILDAAELGNFSLRNEPEPPLNVFLDRDTLQRVSDLEGRANLALMPQRARNDAVLTTLERLLQERWTLADLEAELRESPQGDLELRTRRVFLDPPLARAALAAMPEARPLLTYLANLLRAGTNATPYSMVTAAGSPWTPADLRDDEILLNQWLAEDLGAKPGDEIALVYFDPESGSRLLERTNHFRVRGVVPMELPWADRTLMPEFPGIEKAESTRDWDAGFPLTYTIRPKDENYWRRYRGTPKAFVTLAAGQTMWRNRFGDLTAIRFPPTTAPAHRSERAALLERRILAGVSPAELGLQWQPVREKALRSARESQDFGGLFLGFSVFLIVAALLLMALLFQLGLEQRAPEIGTLLALGFTPGQVRGLLLREGAALAVLGGALGALGGLGYAHLMLEGLNTVWREAVGGARLDFHVATRSLLIGPLAGAAVAVLTIRMALRRFVKLPARALLAGELDPASGLEPSRAPGFGARARGGGRSMVLRATALGALLAGMAMVGLTWARGEQANAAAFFGAGALMLVAGLAGARERLIRMADIGAANSAAPGSRHVSLPALAIRGCARRHSRSVSTIAMLACGVFLVVSIAVFRLDANRDAWERSSGTGGFALIGRTTLPVVHDLNTSSGRDFFALREDELGGASFVPFRVREGEEASCLNLNRAQRPQLLGVKPELLHGRFRFAKGNDWSALRPAAGDGQLAPADAPEGSVTDEIPVIGDANSIRWAMGKRVGDTIEYADERGQSFKVRIVGALANSVLQGSLVMDEAEFVKRFPNERGYRMFLIDAPSNRVAQVSATLSRALEDVGLELVPAAARLAQFNAVQNTYLGTFQVLGGLGLLLGSGGLGIVVLRNALERRGELALLLAVGWPRRQVQRLLLIENGALLLAGLGLGVVAAAVAVLPPAAASAMPWPWRSLSLTLAAVLANGLLWTWAATRLALRGDLLDALRNE